MRQKLVLVPDIPKLASVTDLSIDFSKTGLSETGLSAIDLLEIDLSAIGSLKADLSNLNDLELVREPEETVDESVLENHEAVEWAKRAAVFFQDAAESELAAVLALLCLSQFQAV